ncbi:MAG: hypothetical protein HXY28_04785 [Hydrogenophilaceae bacterium]|jgi:hypothetical protein|nr:hypothetical protein [Hydrogenophilaceae bacterium]
MDLTLSASDNRNHQPTNDSWFQESVVFMWGDPDAGMGGELRFGMHPNRGVANIYAFAVVNGRKADRRLLTDLPLPAGDLLDTELAGFAIETIEPLHSQRIRFAGPDLEMDLTWRAFHEPRTMTLAAGGVSLARGHYNGLGRMTGAGRWRGEPFAIDACGFADHSWGVRRQHVPASRFVVAVFDEEFYIMAMPILTDDGPHMLGYVRDGGRFTTLVAPVDMGYSFRDDWFTPAGCDARLTTQEGRVYRLTGRSVGDSSTQPMGHGKLVTHAIGAFECEGRMGRGVIESSLPRKMPPAQIIELGLPLDSWWVNEEAHR